MDDTKYLKCLCNHCSAPIEFPADGTGLIIPCPHCGAQTTLAVPAPPAPVNPRPRMHVASPSAATSASALTPPAATPSPAAPSVSPVTTPPRRSRGKMYVLAAMALVIMAGGIAAVLYTRRTGQTVAVHETNAAPGSLEPVMPPTPTRPRSLDDLKVGAISLEKRGSLVYAVGVMKNDSDHQRFGVTVELDVLDNLGSRLGAATDYRSVIEPREEWRFRALILHSKAVKAKLATVREAE